MKLWTDTLRAIRGDSWNGDEQSYCGVSMRFKLTRNIRDGDLGFRVVHRKGKK